MLCMDFMHRCFSLSAFWMGGGVEGGGRGGSKRGIS